MRRTLFSVLCIIAIASCVALCQDSSAAASSGYTPVSLTLRNSAKNMATYSLSAFAAIGYGFGIGGIAVPDPLNESVELDNAGAVKKRTDHFLNYGKGMKIEAGAIYMFMERLSGHFSCEYTAGVPWLTIHRDASGTTFDLLEKYHIHQFGVKALVAPQFTVVDLFDVYTGVGIGVFGATCSYTDTNTTLREHEGLIDTRLTLGFLGIAGIEYPLTERFSLHLRAAFEAASYTVKAYQQTNSSIRYDMEKDRSTASMEVKTPIKIPASHFSLRIAAVFKIL